MFGASCASDFALPLAEIGVFDCSNGGCSSPCGPSESHEERYSENQDLYTREVFTNKNMKLFRNIAVFVLLGLLAVMALIAVVRHYYYWIDAAGKYGLTARDAGRAIARYIEQNGGTFPKSERDLVDNGLLKKVETDGNLTYYLKLGPPDLGEKAYYERSFFEQLRIAYGTSPERIELRKGKLYDRETGQPTLIVDGPYKDDLMSQFYLPISVDLYQLMKMCKITKNEPNSLVLEKNAK